METEMRNLDVVTLLENLPGKGLRRGQVGTIVEIPSPGIFIVEFVSDAGETYAVETLREDQIMALRFRPALAA